MMLVVVAYDVSTENSEGRRRLRRVAKICKDHGQPVQNSVFECWIDMAHWVVFRSRLVKEIAEDRDSLRFYFLGDNWKGRMEHVGAKPSYDPGGVLIV